MVSVCLATYNGERFIEQQLASILPQLQEGDELIVSDDGSTDTTLEKIEAVHDSRIKIFKRGQKPDVVKNFESAIACASGDYIFLADQDDIWHLQKIATMKKYLDTHLLVTCDCTIIDEQGNVLHKSFFDKRRIRHGVFHNWIKNSYVGCCMAFRRELIKSILPFPKNVPMHDWWIGLRAEMLSCSYFLPAQLVSLRHHSKNASPTARGQSLPLHKGFLFRVALLKTVVKTILG